MKALKLMAFGIIMIAVQGCYTVIWTPDVALPTKERSENSDTYYEEIYYGEYSSYYEVPWWYSVTPPKRFIIPASERTAQETKVRNGGSPDRGPIERPDQPIILVGNPSVDQTPTAVPPPTTNDRSTKKSESTTPQREKENSSNSRDTRNNDGSRSSDTPRR